MKMAVISQRIEYVTSYNEIRDCTDQKLISFFANAEIVCVPISNTHSYEELSFLLKQLPIELIVLSGGNDVGSEEVRDSTERALIAFGIKNKIPILGICRGMQFIGKYFGAKLIEIDKHVNVRHRLVKSGRWTNSFHSYGLSHCPANFEILDYCDDGIIEAIKHKSLPILGIMWHPEREKQFSENDIQMVKELC